MAEAELNALKKLESNKACVNCGAYNKFGHGNICEKVRTFVCSNCKSAHQSFSMRVKSVTMSNWTKEEVDALKEENGGGNAAAQRVWLGRWDESKLRRPQEGDHIDVFKRFIDKVYNDKAFYDEDAASSPSAPARKSGGGSGSGSSRSVTRTPSSNTPAPNLLDFGSPTGASSSAAPTFDAFASPPKSAANDGWGAFSSAPAPAPAPTSSSNGFNDGFGAFSSAPPAAPAATPAAVFDPFGVSSTPAPAPVSTPSFDPFAAPTSTPAAAFDPFGPSSLNRSAPPAQPTQTGFGMGAPAAPRPMGLAPPSAAANFGAFDALAGPSHGMGMGMPNGMHGGGVHGGMPRGPGMMHGGGGMGMNPAMGMGMGMGMGQPGMMGGAPRPMMGGGNPAMNISSFMAPPNAQGAPHGGAAYGRPGGNSRDPFAGLGLPGK